MPLDKGKNGFTLPKLPYAEEALAPVISANISARLSSIFHNIFPLPTAFAQHPAESLLYPARTSGRVLADEAWNCPEPFGQASRGG